MSESEKYNRQFSTSPPLSRQTPTKHPVGQHPADDDAANPLANVRRVQTFFLFCASAVLLAAAFDLEGFYLQPIAYSLFPLDISLPSVSKYIA